MQKFYFSFMKCNIKTLKDEQDFQQANTDLTLENLENRKIQIFFSMFPIFLYLYYLLLLAGVVELKLVEYCL